MTYLLDTCSVIWSITDESKFRPSTLTLLEEADELLVSHVSLIEMAAKVGSGRLSIGHPFEPFIMRALQELNISILPLDVPGIFRIASLPPIHKDPFDRLLIAQALALDVTIVTPDPKFIEYGVKVLW